MTDSTDMSRRETEFLLYQTKDGRTRVEVRFDGETAWLSLGQMAELFHRDKSVISRHVKNVFEEGELSLEATVAKSATVQREGDREVTREVEYYNLDVIALYRATKAGFPDCLALELARVEGHLPFATFDRATARLPGAAARDGAPLRAGTSRRT